MSAIPSISIPITFDRPTCQSGCQCCTRASKENLSARIYVMDDEGYHAARPSWWQKICGCCYKAPTIQETQDAIIQYKAHLYAQHGKSIVRQAQSASKIDLEDKIENYHPLTIREIIFLEQTIRNLEKFHLSHLSKRAQVDEVRAMLDDTLSNPTSPPPSPKKHRKKKEQL